MGLIGLADEMVVFVSRRVIGGSLAPSPVAGEGPARICDVPTPVVVRRTQAGEDDVYRLLLTDAAKRWGRGLANR